MTPDQVDKLPKYRKDWLEIWGNQWGGAKVMAGTCEACVWGRGAHTEGCEHRRRWSEILRPIASLNVGLAMLLVCLLLALTVSHARPVPSIACADELLVRWNQFAADANAHVQTLDVREASREKARARLDREWASVTELRCW